jgi:selenocysteine lyase/cysteine desulfurase
MTANFDLVCRNAGSQMTARVLYLNHAGTSWPKPVDVSVAVQDAMSASPTAWPRRFEEAHQAIADFFGVNDCQQILLTPGCTSALTVGIGDALIANGQCVLTSRWEHHALHRPLLKTASAGARVEYIPPRTIDSTDRIESPIDPDWLDQRLSRQDVALVAITAACNVTGELLPYQRVIEITQRHGAMVLIDAAQIVGWLELDLPRLGADMVAFGGHKGLQGPWGIGGLYLSERARMECSAATCELNLAGTRETAPARRPGYCDVGSVDQFALAGLHAAIKGLRERNLGDALADARRQVRRIRSALEQFDRLRFFGPVDPDRGLPTLALAVSGFSSSEVASRLRQHSLLVGSGLQCAPLAHQTMGTQDMGLVRLSIGLGQPDDEIDEAIERLESAFHKDFCHRQTGKSVH